VTRVFVPAERVLRWFENFESRHGSYDVQVVDGCLRAAAADGATAAARLPFDRPFTGASVEDLAAAAAQETRWGVLLVRRGGFAAAAGTGGAASCSKVGQRHVQGKTKAGGWSQQRFARRRDNQAREAFEAAADHAHRILVTEFGGVDALVCGGDRAAVDAVLADPRLEPVASVRTSLWLPVPDPRREVLDKAIRDARSCVVQVSDGDPAG
jgi:hypothetical protein